MFLQISKLESGTMGKAALKKKKPKLNSNAKFDYGQTKKTHPKYKM